MGDSDRSAWEAIAQGPGKWEALGRAIKVERVARGWERKDLAERSGLSYTYLSEIESGKKRPSWGALGSIAEALGVRPSELLDVAETWTGPAAASAPSLERSVAAEEIHAPVRAVSAMYSKPSRRSDPRRGEILRELLEFLQQLPTDDLERLRELARALRD
jgi:transcriptional regulator with XRE-family HTH domain